MELKRYWEIICRRQRLIIQAVLIISGTALLLSFLLPTIYGVSAKVYIKLDNLQPALVSDISMFNQSSKLGELNYAESRNLVDSYLALINTQPVVSKVIETLNLTDILGRTIEVKDFIVSPFQYPYLILIQRKGVQLQRLRAAELIEISGYSTDRAEAAKIANLMAKSFADFQAQLFRQEVAVAHSSIDKQLVELQQKLREAQEREANFRSSNNLPDINLQTNMLIVGISNLEASRNEILRNIHGFQSRLSEIKNKIKKSPEFLKKKIVFEKNPQLEQYKSDLLNFEVELAGALTELTENHPEISKIRNKISQAKAGIRKEIAKTFSEETSERNPYFDSLVETYGNSEINIISQNAQLKMLDKQIEDKATQMKMIPIKRKELDRYTKETELLNNITLSMKHRCEWLGLLETLDISNTITVQKAVPALRPRIDKFFPKRLKILIFSLLVGLPFGIFLACLVDYFDDTIKTSQDITDKLDQPVLGVIPYIHSIGSESILSRRTPESLDQFWNLSSNIELTTLAKEENILAIASTVPGEGKTTVCSQLALVLAEKGQKVLLVDLNLRRPRLHTIFERSNSDPGVTDFLGGHINLEQVVYPTSRENLYLMPAGPAQANPVKIFDLSGLRHLAASLRGNYDKIIFDTPSQEDGGDLQRIALFADNLLLVVSAGEVSEKKVERALETLKSHVKNVLGLVLNIRSDSDSRKSVIGSDNALAGWLKYFFRR